MVAAQASGRRRWYSCRRDKAFSHVARTGSTSRSGRKRHKADGAPGRCAVVADRDFAPPGSCRALVAGSLRVKPPDSGGRSNRARVISARAVSARSQRRKSSLRYFSRRLPLCFSEHDGADQNLAPEVFATFISGGEGALAGFDLALADLQLLHLRPSIAAASFSSSFGISYCFRDRWAVSRWITSSAPVVSLSRAGRVIGDHARRRRGEEGWRKRRIAWRCSCVPVRCCRWRRRGSRCCGSAGGLVGSPAVGAEKAH